MMTNHTQIREAMLKTFIFVLIVLVLVVSTAATAKEGQPTHAPQRSTTGQTASPLLPPGTEESAKPSPAGIQEEDFKAGMQHYHDQKYAEAISALSRYASLAPSSQQRTAALLIVGKSLEEMNNLRSALNVYSRITDQNPDSPEAWLSVVALADIGLSHPDLSGLGGKKGTEYVKDPVTAYETALSNKVPLPVVEHIHHQRSRALWKSKRFEEALQASLLFLRNFPQTPYREETQGIMRNCTATLIHQYHESGDHLAVANLFVQGRKEGSILATDVDVLLKSCSSLSSLGLHEAATGILDTLKKNPRLSTEEMKKIAAAAAEMEKGRAEGAAELGPADPKWGQFQSGREHLRANRLTSAEKTLSELKDGSNDPFWTKIAEYALEENRWNQKYRPQIGP